MGATNERWLAYTSAAKGEAAGARAQEQTQTAEQQRRFGEMYLGSEEQLAGGGGYDPSIIPFTQRYTYDEQTIAALGGGGWGNDAKMAKGIAQSAHAGAYAAAVQGGDYANTLQGYTEFITDRANTLMDEAQKLAEAGDMEAAEAKRREAETFVQTSNPTATTGPQGGSFLGAFYLKDNADYVAKAQLAGPMAQTAGQIVKEGREILDRSSETSRAFRQSLTEGARRSIAATQRGAQRSARMAGLAGAGARSPGAQAAIASSAAREAGQLYAQVESQAAQVYEQYRTSFAQQSVTFGMGYLDAQAGVRDEFVAANNQLLMHQSEMMMQAAQLSYNFAQLAQQQEQFEQGRTDAFIGMGVGALTDIATSLIGRRTGGGAPTKVS